MERKIAQMPCIGAMKRWERRYFYKSWMEDTIFHIDTAVISFDYREAGKFGFKSGRRFYAQEPAPMLDDRSYLTVYGSYDWRDDKVTVNTCGLNFPEQ